MLLGLLRNFVIIFLVLTVVYAILWITSRLRERDRLKDEYIRADTHLSKDDYIDRGMEDYNYSLKSKLLLGVYVVPLALFGLLYYLANII